MEQAATRMKAFLLTLDVIEVQLTKQYYGGLSPTFYLRNIETQEVKSLKAKDCQERDTYFSYYFEEVPIDITQVYEVIDAYGLSETVQYTTLLQMENFEEHFYYPDNDLGSLYTKQATSFKVWAPIALEIRVQIETENKTYLLPLQKAESGIFSGTLNGDFDNASYVYLVRHYNHFVETTDPYSYSSTTNGRKSKIIDITKLDNVMYRENLPTMENKTDAIIYETSVRDFTIDESISAKYPGKFLGMIESGLKTRNGNLAGVDYIVDLGITHLQLMPIFDFATVDEKYPDQMYNWGYDPSQYNVPEGSYCTNPEDGYCRIDECKQMIAGLHKRGIRVVMDVVYNHMYDVQATAYEKLMPGYFFRKDEQGNLSNGSWCGNDVNTTAPMIRKYIVDMCLRWQQLYGIDGYRFDLMGLIDIETLSQVEERCRDNDADFIVYGEGWNMETAIQENIRGIQENHQKMPRISFFNDHFRDKLKGLSGDSDLSDKGYFSGNMYNTWETCKYLLNVDFYTRVDQSINYVECHDNATVFDKYEICNPEEGEELRKRRQLLLNCTCMISQGVPFLHSGQEFYRTKHGVTNSYRSPDYINMIDWSKKDQYLFDIDVLKRIIRLRKENIGFRYATREEVYRYVSAHEYNNQMIRYMIHQENQEYQTIVIYINASFETFQIDIEQPYEIIDATLNEKEIVEIRPVSMLILGIRC